LESRVAEVLAGCPVCGQVVSGPGPCRNHWCRRADRGFSVVFTAGTHQAALRRGVLRYKYQGERWWAPVFARMLGRYLLANAPWFEEFDLLTGVPSYLGPGARRNWDPVGEVVDRLAPLLGPGWEVAPRVVVKTRETPPMQGRTAAERQVIAAGPVRRALTVPAPERVAGARILAVDDVLTEGSTLREVALALRRAGAREVAGLVIARPRWPAGPGPVSGR
jgi:predicted amidophosphoribosyltransferase